MIIRITYKQLWSDIETDVKLDKLQIILTYLQLIKSQMPIFPFTKSVVMPHEAAFILAKVYGCKEVDCKNFDEEVKIKTSSENVLLLEENISEIARPGVRHAFLTCVRQQAALELDEYSNSKTGAAYPTIKKELEKIDHALATGEVKAERGRVSFEGKKYAKTVFVPGKADIPRFTNLKVVSMENPDFRELGLDPNEHCAMT